MYSASARANINALATTYARAKGTSLRAVSKRFYGHADFLAAFVKGKRSISLKTLDEMIEDFRVQWPHGIPWPPMEHVIIPSIRSRSVSKSKQIT